MNDLIKLALALAEDSAVRHSRQAAAQMTFDAIVTVAAAVCALAALACGLAALWIDVLPSAGAVGTPLIVAVVLLALSFAMIALLRAVLKSRHEPPAVDGALALLLGEAKRQLNDHKGPVLTAALLVGLFAGTFEKK
jgi:hypothetical protein